MQKEKPWGEGGGGATEQGENKSRGYTSRKINVACAPFRDKMA